MMQLRGLRVQNIRSYAEADLDLGAGTTLLIGDVGAGKTSLLYAIEMALFGFAEVDATYLIRHQAPHAEVHLRLADAAHTYEFRRRFRRRSVRGRPTFQLESSSFSEDGSTRTYSATELRRRTIDLLGFPDNPNPRAHSDLWRWAVYIPQERMREVLEQNPSDRLETVRKALGLEQYRIAAENAQLVATELGRRAERKDAEAAGLAHFADGLVQGRAELERAQRELETLRASESDTRRDAEARDSALREAEARHAVGTTAIAEARALAERLRLLGASLDRLRAQAADGRARRTVLGEEVGTRPAVAAELEEVTREVDRLRSTRDGTREALGRLQSERAKLEAARAALRAARQALETAGAELDRERRVTDDRGRAAADAEALGPTREPPAPTPRTLAEIGESAPAAQEAVDRWAAEQARAELVARDLEELLREGRCPRCHQAVRPEEFASHRAESRAEVERATQAFDAARAERDRLDAERRARERYERAHLSWAHAEERRRSARAALDEANARRVAAEARVGERTDEVARQERVVAELEPVAGALAAAEQALADAEGRLEERQRAQARLTTRGELLVRKAEELERLQAELARWAAEAEERERERTHVEATRAEREGVVRELPGLTAALETARTERESARRRLDEVTVRIGAATQAEVHARESVRRSEEGATRHRALQAEAHRARAVGAWLTDRFREVMVKLEVRLLARAQADFERTFGRFFHTLVDDPSLLARCDTSFSPAVEINGEWTPAEALSGGERTALALAYRLALGHVVRSFGQLTLETLILDEPTDGFSPEQVIRMGELLDELGLPQVLLVSHEGGLASVADHVVRVRKDGGTSALSAETAGAPAAPRPPPAEARAAPAPRRRRRTLDDPTPPATP